MYPSRTQGRDFVLGALEEESGQILGRWIDGLEWFQIINHLMIEVFHGRAQRGLELLEVKQQAAVVQVFACECDEHAVVVAVWVLTLPMIISQIVAGRESRFHCYFKHWVSFSFFARGFAAPKKVIRAGTAFMFTTNGPI